MTIKGRDDHPIVELLRASEYEFQLIGSRYYSDKPPYATTDWDFMADGAREGTESWSLQREIGKWLEELGFKHETIRGYAIDSAAEHYRWPQKNGSPQVDVLITRYEGEFDRRVAVFKKMKGSHGDLQWGLKNRLKGWADFFSLIRELEREWKKE